MLSIDYQKKKNIELFKEFEKPSFLFLSNTQNYIPIYKRFFSLNETNYNNINFKHKWNLQHVVSQVDDNSNLFLCELINQENKKTINKPIFFKFAPLLDPYKFMVGKYELSDKLFQLPQIKSSEQNCMKKMIDANNSAYVDGLFLFLSSQLKDLYNFVHSVEYYGMFLSIKNKFRVNIYDDIDYLNNSEFFNQNKNILFDVDEYDYLLEMDKPCLPPLKIGKNVSLKSIDSFDNGLFEDIFIENNHLNNDETEKKDKTFDGENNTKSEIIDLNMMKEMNMELVELTNQKLTTYESVKLLSHSSCSSRTSHTLNTNYSCENCEENKDSISNSCHTAKSYSSKNGTEVLNSENGDNISTSTTNSILLEEEQIFASIHKFPVQVIAMENCKNTLDNLIIHSDLTDNEWLSALMQVIMILITYQKVFQFTHNDLHTSNIMYIETNKKHLYYCYNNQYYKVPTFGRIFKIIDFGRSIYKFNGKIFCSDSFQTGEDAATQYNTEPYFNENKPRLEPNMSFDLCRLACSIYDYLIRDDEEPNERTIIQKIIYEWCLDDKGTNILYKNDGTERYPDFKLYKMIARCVHNHTPQLQLNRPEFKKFSLLKSNIKNINEVIHIDNMKSCV